MVMHAAASIEIDLIGWSVVLLLIHIAVQGAFAIPERGLAWNAGPRDDARPATGRMAGRAARTLANFKETYPAFIALALALAVTGRAGGVGETGSWLWLGARIVYLPLYLLGVPWLRTLAYGASLVGLIMMLSRVLVG
jgi:uncharacterized MAPEG superfamily protein